MLETCRRLALGLVLIAAASALLLYSDLGSRKTPGKSAPVSGPAKQVAVLQHASQVILDDGRNGMLAGLAEQGWTEGKNVTLKRYNAEGDMTVAQAIAREMANGGNDLLLTISTPSLQAVANANRTRQIPHVFALVTDPVAAGVGIENPTDHPGWLAGFGTMQPIARAFQTAREINPDLKTVGVVWNAAEANSEAQIKLARQTCAEMGITLREVTVENSAGVAEAAASLCARGVDAIWVCGDVAVITAIDSVIAAGNKSGVPVFTVIPPNVKRGALFDLGADYYEVGRKAGSLAGEILNGKDPASVEIVNFMPEMLAINLQAAKNFGEKWTISSELAAKARMVIAEDGSVIDHSPAPAVPADGAAVSPPNPSGKCWKIAIVLYNESPPADETLDGMRDGWKESGLKEGKDYSLTIKSAQGDMAALSGLLDSAVTEGADLIVPLSTPTLQTAVHRIRNTPIVFSLVANPIAAGAGTSYTDHLPNVTGVAVLSPYADMLDLLDTYYPHIKKLGTLFCPSEANSVDLKVAFEELCLQRGFTLEAIAANSPGELPDAALSLVSRPIDAVVQISDNLSSAGFTAIAKAARQAQKPLFSLNSTTGPLGAPVSLGRDYHDAGVTTVRLIERVIAGENPAHMPFILPPKVRCVVSTANARALGMTLPEKLVESATVVLPDKP